MLILLTAVSLFSLVLIGFYNRAIGLKNLVLEAASGIDVQLKRRHDLIPNLVETVKAYGRYEKNTLEEVTRARTQAQNQTAVSDRSKAELELGQRLRGFLALAEAYPDLKANQEFLALHTSLVKIEDEIQMARRYYNGSVRNLNTCIQSFPGNVLASIFQWKSEPFFEIEYATERQTPDVQF